MENDLQKYVCVLLGFKPKKNRVFFNYAFSLFVFLAPNFIPMWQLTMGLIINNNLDVL